MKSRLFLLSKMMMNEKRPVHAECSTPTVEINTVERGGINKMRRKWERERRAASRTSC